MTLSISKSMLPKWASIATLVGALAVWAPSCAAPVDAHSKFTTLGTMSGPAASPTRSQPANLLQYGDQNILVDAGDGAAEQLSKTGVSLDSIQTIILTHH